MNSPEHYRERAKKCRVLAENHQDEICAKRWADQAIVYDRLAENAEDMLEIQWRLRVKYETWL